jgi:hypothetical protein
MGDKVTFSNYNPPQASQPAGDLLLPMERSDIPFSEWNEMTFHLRAPINQSINHPINQLTN